MLAAALERDERGSRTHAAAVERQVGNRETRVTARLGAEQVAERAAASGYGGHHGFTRAWATTVIGSSASASGGTASTRNAPETMLAKTGAAMSPPW